MNGKERLDMGYLKNNTKLANTRMMVILVKNLHDELMERNKG